MKFRRWIFGTSAVLAILFLTPFFIPDPAPPFKFLEKAHLRYINVDEDGGKTLATSSYFVEGDWHTVMRSAQVEIPSWTHHKDPLGSDDFVSGDRHLRIVNWNFGSEREPVTHVLYEQPPRFVDRVRAPVHRVRSWF